MKKVLFIAYYYPPLGGIGSQRSQKFARYLLEYGWQAIVLTPEKGSYLLDPSLEDGESKGIEVVRTQAVELSSILKRAVLMQGPSGGVVNGGVVNGAAGVKPAQIQDNSLMNFARRAVRTWGYIPDGQIGWFPYAVRAARRILEMQEWTRYSRHRFR